MTYYNVYFGSEYSLTDAHRQGLIRLRQNGETLTPSQTLGEYWKQSMVQVKLGGISNDKQMLVTFELVRHPDNPVSIQFFINETYQDDPSMDLVDIPINQPFTRMVLVAGDGTNKDVFMRPSRYASKIYVKNVTWELFG